MGTLYLVATPIGNLEDMSPRAIRVLREARLIAAEDTRHTRQLLTHFDIHTPLSSYYEHNKLTKLEAILAALSQGDVALVSDAGTPAINDPGYELVKAALDSGHPVSPIPGPSAPVAALAASGLPTDSFLYLGYLPRKTSERKTLFEQVGQYPYTLLFLESPHRVLESLADMEAFLGDRQMAAARELTKVYEQFVRGRISQVRAHFTENEPRGEFVLVVSGKQTLDAGRWTEEKLFATIQQQIQSGKSAKEIAAELAEQSGWSKKDVYALVNRGKGLMPASVRCRARGLGLIPGILSTGSLNAITDVDGVRVGHFTLLEGDDIRTGATAILPHGGNLYQDKVPAGFVVGNGYGKFAGSTQIVELGEIETPIVLTSTLAVPRAADAILDWTLAQPGNENVRSINPVVGETNDGLLNNSRKRALTVEHIRQAIDSAENGPLAEGCVGAGTGTICFGWKGGIGTSSRRLPESLGGHIVGALVQTNYGGILQMGGVEVGKALGQYYLKDKLETHTADGSIIIVLATDAPLSDRNLTRLARRGLGGLARTGASLGDGSGDYALAFSTAESVRRTPERRSQEWAYPEIPNERVSPLFLAAIEAVEEAIYNSLTMATSMTGYRGVTIQALPLEKMVELLHQTAGTIK